MLRTGYNEQLPNPPILRTTPIPDPPPRWPLLQAVKQDDVASGEEDYRSQG